MLGGGLAAFDWSSFCEREDGRMEKEEGEVKWIMQE